MEDLHAIGFVIDQFSKTAYSISGIPAQLAENDAVLVLRDIIHNVEQTGINAAQQWQEQIAVAMANDMAIPYGKTLTQDEMQDLVQHLLSLPTYMRTPDGKKVLTILSDGELRDRI